MPDPIVKVATEPIQPVAVAIIGTGDGASMPMGGLATTPGAQPNLMVTVVTPVRAIAVRFVNSFLTTLVGLVMAGMATNVIPATDFMHLVMQCAKLSIAGAGLGLLKDCVTVFGKLEQKYPLGTGSV